MADDILTLADVIADAQNLSDAEVSDLERKAPFVAMLPAEEASDGTSHRYVKEIGAPIVGFRSINAGRDLDHSEDVEVVAALKYLDFSFEVDVALADRRRGKNRGPEWLLAREGNRSRNSALYTYESQILNGLVSGSAAGFEGFADQTPLLYKDSSMVIDATGSTASTGASVYAVCVGPNDVTAVYNGDQPVMMKEPSIQRKQDGSGKSFDVYRTPAGTWLGLQVGSAKSVGRICNLTAQAGKGLTDALIADLLSLFTASSQVTHLLMNRRSLAQLQKSRTATSATGAPAPFPSESFGVPIMLLDCLSKTEALLGATP